MIILVWGLCRFTSNSSSRLYTYLVLQVGLTDQNWTEIERHFHMFRVERSGQQGVGGAQNMSRVSLLFFKSST